MDFRRSLKFQRSPLGPVIGKYTDRHLLLDEWQPFPEDVHADNPGPFRNVIVR